MDISQFRDLERLSKMGNFSQAARLSNLSQSAFSRRMQSLETWVGVPLIDRSHQPVTLTAAGNLMLEAGLEALARIELERSQILEAQSLPDKYVVTFGTQHSIGWRFYPAWLQSFENAFGPILSRLRADDLPGCIQDLKDGDVDFVIAYHREGDVGDHAETLWGKRADRLSSLVIGRDQLVPVCKPNAEGGPMFAFDTDEVEMPYLRFGEAAPIGRHLELLFKTKQLHKRLRTVYQNSMAGALRIRAHAGDGVAWLPQSLIAPDLERGLLVQTGHPDWRVQLDIRLYANLQRSTRLTRSIWTFLSRQQPNPQQLGIVPLPVPQDQADNSDLA